MLSARKSAEIMSLHLFLGPLNGRFFSSSTVWASFLRPFTQGGQATEDDGTSACSLQVLGAKTRELVFWKRGVFSTVRI